VAWRNGIVLRAGSVPKLFTTLDPGLVLAGRACLSLPLRERGAFPHAIHFCVGVARTCGSVRYRHATGVPRHLGGQGKTSRLTTFRSNGYGFASREQASPARARIAVRLPSCLRMGRSILASIPLHAPACTRKGC
jgi:hypothetical protein